MIVAALVPVYLKLTAAAPVAVKSVAPLATSTFDMYVTPVCAQGVLFVCEFRQCG